NDRTRPTRVAVVVSDTPVFIHPRQLLEPLAKLNVGASLPVTEASADWFLITFPDQYLGPRVGYVHCSNVVARELGTVATIELTVPTVPESSTSGEKSATDQQLTGRHNEPVARSGMSTKKKIAIAAAITGAVIGAAILASKAGGGGGGAGAAV